MFEYTPKINKNPQDLDKFNFLSKIKNNPNILVLQYKPENNLYDFYYQINFTPTFISLNQLGINYSYLKNYNLSLFLLQYGRVYERYNPYWIGATSDLIQMQEKVNPIDTPNSLMADVKLTLKGF